MTIVYLHGGAFTSPLVREHWDVVTTLATQNAARVVVPLYRLAPVGNAASEVAWVAALVRELHVGGAGPLVLSGDSAGGGLAAAVAAEVADVGLAHLLLLAPWLDVTLGNPAVAAVEEVDPGLAAVGLRYSGRLWAGDLPAQDPRVSPVFADPLLLCRTTVVVGTLDLLEPDCRLFAQRAGDVGVDVRYVEAVGAFHVFVGAPYLPESRWAFKIVRERLSR